MSAIVVYADSLEALTNGSNDAELDSNSSEVAKNLEALAAEEKFTAVGANGIAGINAAVASISKFIIERRENPKITDVSARLQRPLTAVVDALKSENDGDEQGLKSKATTLTDEFTNAVSLAHKERGAGSLLDIYQARQALDNLIVQPQGVAQLNAALDALLAANKALADPESAEASSKVSILIHEGRAAVTLFRASK